MTEASFTDLFLATKMFDKNKGLLAGKSALNVVEVDEEYRHEAPKYLVSTG